MAKAKHKPLSNDRKCSECGASPVLSRGLCRSHYALAYRAGRVDVRMSAKAAAAKASLEGVIELGKKRGARAGSCLIWLHSRDSNGYATIAGQKTILVSRLVCEGVHGPEPEGRPWCLHNCDRGYDGCVEPTHLEWGDVVKNNGLDRARDGTLAAGEAHGQAKLTWKAVDEIRSGMYADETQAEIGARYGVGQWVISDVMAVRTWRPQNRPQLKMQAA